MADETIKVLYDTDIGTDIDDAVALAYLLCQPRCELVGITTVASDPVLRAEIASAVCRNVGRDDVPIHAGIGTPLLVPTRGSGPGQAAALGEWDRRREFPVATAIEFMWRTIRANPGEVTLLAVGPMTNVATLFATDPEIPAMLKQLVLMCGSFYGGRAEWNASGDPHATAITYGNGSQSRPPRHVSFGLDVTMKCEMPAAACRERFTAKVLQPVRDLAEVWFASQDRITFHDPLAAACIFQPDLCEYHPGTVSVLTTPPVGGWTMFTDLDDDKPHTIARDVTPQAFFEHYFDIVR